MIVLSTKRSLNAEIFHYVVKKIDEKFIHPVPLSECSEFDNARVRLTSRRYVLFYSKSTITTGPRLPGSHASLPSVLSPLIHVCEDCLGQSDSGVAGDRQDGEQQEEEEECARARRRRETT